jgi:diguanylate cyclase (GGDEF)-like protein
MGLGYPNGFVTASIGVAEYRPEHKEEDVLVAADRALYRAKAAGRNRVRVATGTESEEPSP